MISKYDLLALPVVDAENRLQGIVTADDALDKIIPTAWKKRLPRFFR
jgi:Mg/Co/Ni transporter MgtE